MQTFSDSLMLCDAHARGSLLLRLVSPSLADTQTPDAAREYVLMVLMIKEED